MEIVLLVICLLMSGVYFSSLKPVDTRCKSMSELMLFTGCFSVLACVGALITLLVQKGSFYIPWSGLVCAVVFGIFFAFCVFANLKALSAGPLSLTTLIVNFSLVFPVIYAFILEDGATITRIIGLAILVSCMFLFANPKLSGDEKITKEWIWLAGASMLFNGILTILVKVYAMETDNQYSAPFLMYGYFFAAVVAVLIVWWLAKSEKPEGFTLRSFFTPSMYGFIFLAGASNYIMNLIVVLLATRMNGAIVYPVVQGGGPVVAAIASKLVFGEELNRKKITAIILGVCAIVLLNL